MVKELADYLEETSPKFNSFALEGMAVNDIPKIEANVDREMGKLNNPNGLSYEGYSRVRPEEEIADLLKSPRRAVDLNVTDFWPIKLNFKYRGSGDFTKKLLLPYVERAGICRVNGTKYGINPVLSHNVISIAKNGVFMKLDDIKMLVTRKPVNVIIDNVITETEIVSSTGLFKKTQTSFDVGFPIVIAGMYGWSHMLKMAGINPTDVIITPTKKQDLVDTHVEFRSLGLKPRGIPDYGYLPTTIHIYITKDSYKVNKHAADRIFGTVFSLIDHFPEKGKYIVSSITSDSDTQKNFWVLMLTLMYYKGKVGETGFTNTRIMLEDIESYLDPKSRDRLVYDNIIVSNFYELLMRVTLDIATMRNGPESRYLDILTYLPYKVYEGINKLRTQDRNNTSPVTLKTMMSATSRFIMYRAILNGFKSSNTNLTITSVSNTTDNLFLGITSIVELQDSGRGNDRDNGAKLKDDAKHVHALDIRQGNLHVLKKKKYIPIASLNPMAKFSEDGRLILTEREQLESHYLQNLLLGRLELREGEELMVEDSDIDLD